MSTPRQAAPDEQGTRSTSILAAIALPLIGVLLGAAITIGYQTFRDHQETASNLRVAKREVAEQVALLQNNLNAFATWQGPRLTPRLVAQFLPRDQWASQENVLA